jgi:D-alanyl-D-alanine carboxypeptidase (penicillin-binding protein 5/6)
MSGRGVASAAQAAETGTATVAGPKVLAKGAILVDATTGAVLWEREGDTRRPPASLTKMLTALTAEKSLPASKRLTISAKAAKVEPTKVGLPTGRHVTVEQALSALMMISANDMAISLAEAAGRDPDGGTSSPAAGQARFIEALNAQSERLGMDHSTWKTPNGLDAPGHRTTPFDLAIAARAVLRDPKLAKIVRREETLRIVTPDGAAVYLRPRNGFLRGYAGAIGIKTGFTNDAGHCLAAAATRNGRTLITIVLDSPNPITASTALMDWGFGRGKAQRTGQRLPDYVAPASVEELLAPPPPPTTRPPAPDIDPEASAGPRRDVPTNALAGGTVSSWVRAAASPGVLLPGAAGLTTGCSALLLLARRRRRRRRWGHGGTQATVAGRAAGRHAAGAARAGRHEPGATRPAAGAWPSGDGWSPQRDWPPRHDWQPEPGWPEPALGGGPVRAAAGAGWQPGDGWPSEGAVPAGNASPWDPPWAPDTAARPPVRRPDDTWAPASTWPGTPQGWAGQAWPDASHGGPAPGADGWTRARRGRARRGG